MKLKIIVDGGYVTFKFSATDPLFKVKIYKSKTYLGGMLTISRLAWKSQEDSFSLSSTLYTRITDAQVKQIFTDAWDEWRTCNIQMNNHGYP